MPDPLRELWYLKQLRQCVAGIPNSTPDRPEPPDFHFEGAGSLGIELTEFHLPTPPGQPIYQEQESLRKRVLAVAKRQYGQLGGHPVYVDIRFGNCPLKNRDTNRIGDAVARMLFTHRGRSTGVLDRVKIPVNTLGPHIADLSYTASMGNENMWQTVRGGFVAEVWPATVQKVIDHKEGCARVARQRCLTLWLAIVQDYTHLAAFAELATEAKRHEYSGPFDRVLWFIAPELRASDLRCRLVE